MDLKHLWAILLVACNPQELKPGALGGNVANPVLILDWIWCRGSLHAPPSSLCLLSVALCFYLLFLCLRTPLSLASMGCPGSAVQAPRSLCINLVQCPWRWRAGLVVSPSVLCPALKEVLCYYICWFLFFSAVLSIPVKEGQFEKIILTVCLCLNVWDDSFWKNFISK